MKFEALEHTSPEDEPQFEKIADSMESLSGPLAEGFLMCFNSKQIKVFVENVFQGNAIDLSLVQYIPEEDVPKIIRLSAGYFDLKDEDQMVRAKEIADLIQSIAKSRMEEVSVAE